MKFLTTLGRTIGNFLNHFIADYKPSDMIVIVQDVINPIRG